MSPQKGRAGDHGAGQGEGVPPTSFVIKLMLLALCAQVVGTTRHDQKTGLQKSVGRFPSRVTSWASY